MTNRLMMSVAAAALIAGTGFAHAQGTGMDRNAPAAEHTAPAQSQEKMQPQGGKNQRAQDNMKAAPRDEKSAQENNMKREQPAGTSAQSEEKAPAGREMKAEDRNGNMNAESKGESGRRSETVGQAGAGGKLSSEQRTRISTVIRGEHVQPVTNVNFSISVGTRVPRDVSFHPLPPEVITYYPEWRGYEFILVNEQIVVVDPRTFEIVAVIDA